MARETKILLGNCFLFSDLWKEYQGRMSEVKTKTSTPERGDIFSFKKRAERKKSPVFYTRQGYQARNFLASSYQYGGIKKVDCLNYGKKSEKQPQISLEIKRDGFRMNWRTDELLEIIGLKEKFSNWTFDFFRQMPLSRAWNVSLAGAMIFGMLSMTMVYRYLGQSVSARMQSADVSGNQTRQERVLGEANYNSSIDPQYITQVLSEGTADGKELNADEFENKLREMVAGYPIEQMVPYIAKQNHITAAFMIAIAKKESGWGKHVPVLDGGDCYNYWGFRAIRDKMGTGGHTCFDSPEDAVKTVAKRIDFLVSKEGLDTPSKMIVWKCGYDCSWDSSREVKKWISDVDRYFQQLNEK